MNIRLPLKAIQAFEAAARHGAFASAAAELYVTPSAVSHQVKQLESHVGTQLFHRVHRAVMLTDAGKKYAAALTSAFQQMERATRDVARTEKSDILTIHCAPSIAAQWLMPRLARFSAAHPDMDVRINASTDAADLSRGMADIDIRYGQRPTTSGDVLAIPLPDEKVVPLCSPRLLRGRAPLKRAEDLSRFPLIHSESCLVGWRDYFVYMGVSRPIDVARGLRFDRSFMSINAAVDGLGVCLESLFLVERELESGKLIAPLGFRGLTVSGYTFHVLKTNANTTKVKWFREWLFAEIEHSSARYRA